MRRRDFLAAVSTVGTASVMAMASVRKGAEVIVPVHQVVDSRVKGRPHRIEWFQSVLWPEAARDLMRCGVRLQTTRGESVVGRPPERQPVITGLVPGAINLVITDRIPAQWDYGRALCGVTTLYRGYHLCMVAVDRAHGHHIPFVSVNTCLHELLHALLHDIFQERPGGLTGDMRELQVDFHATRLWLLGDDGTVREAARRYVDRLKSGAPS